MAKQVNISEARTHLSRLLREALAGQEVVITKAGKPVARLVPITEPARPRGPRKPGSAEGRIWISDSFFDPLPEDILKVFGE